MIKKDFTGADQVEKILEKRNAKELTDEERAILNARRSYLTGEEKERFEISDDGDSGTVGDTINNESNETNSGNDSIDLNSLSVKDLKQFAADKEIDIDGLTKKADLIEAISASIK